MTTEGDGKEIEYKFQLPEPGADAAVVDFLRSKGYRISQRRKIHQEDLYLDTFDWRLFRHGFSLRLRQANGQALYTLKNIAKIKDGRAERREIEVAVRSKDDDPAAVPVKEIRAEIDAFIYPRRLLGQLIVRTERQPYIVTGPQGLQIELVFDCASFMARGLNKPRIARRLFELEAELQKGAEADLEAFQRLLTDHFGFLPSHQSKLETAMQRLGIVLPSKKPPENLQVQIDDRFDQAVQKILTFQFRHLEDNIPGVLADLDTEFVHQARVATRRMRSLLRLFKGVLPEKSEAYFGAELLWLGSLFGGVRDLDVFLLNLPHSTQAVGLAPRRAIKILKQCIEEERSVRLAELKAGLTSQRWGLFRSRLLAYTGRQPAKRPMAPLALNPVHKVAPPVITKRFASVITQGRKVLAKPKLKNFHRLRIQFKRLRYAAEFMSTAYGDALHDLIGEAVNIQDCLGDLQDTVFTRSLIVRLVKAWRGSIMDPQLLFLLGEIYELQGEKERLKQAEFREIWKRFDQETVQNDLIKALQHD